VSNRVVLAAFVLVGLFVACSDDHAPPSPVAVPRTGRFTMTITATAPGRQGTLRASGSFDDDRRRYALDADVEGFVPGLDGPLAVVATPEVVFLDCPYVAERLGAPTRWIKLVGASGDLIRTSLLDPLQTFVRNGRGGFVPATTMRFAGGADGGAEVSVEFFDIGAPVAIEPPAPELVTDETAEVNRLFAATGG
jgi:hypothetical protein